MKLIKQNYGWAKLIFTNKRNSKLHGYSHNHYSKLYWSDDYVIAGYQDIHRKGNKTFYI